MTGLPEIVVRPRPVDRARLYVVTNLRQTVFDESRTTALYFASRCRGYPPMIITIDGPAGSGKSTAARKLAATLAARAPMALAWVKEAINHGSDKTQAEGLKLEADLFARTFETKDHHEGIKAFIEKRTPDFQGH